MTLDVALGLWALAVWMGAILAAAPWPHRG